MGQIMYDYVCLSIPMQRVHPEGQCNPLVMKYLNIGAKPMEEGKTDVSPFSSLRDFLEKKEK